MLAQQLLNGILSGAVYALFALGFTLMFGVLGVINLTYGVYLSAGALIALFATRYGLSIWLALPLATLLTGCIAVVVDALLLTPLRRAKAPELASLMVTLGATLLLYSAANALFGTDIRRFPPAVIDSSAIELLGIRITVTQMLIIGAAIVMVSALLFMMNGTRIGLGVRALAEKPDIAELMGVDSSGLVRLVSFVSGALAGTSGVLIGLNYNAIQPYMGETMMLRGFAVIIIGGLGDVRGAVAAGLLLGVAEVMAAGYIDSMVKDGVAFTLMVLVLWLKPAGLLGRARVSRA